MTDPRFDPPTATLPRRPALTPEMPTSWKSVRIGDLTRCTSGGTPNTTVPAYWNGGIPWLSSGELKHGVIHSTERSVTERGLRESSTKMIPAKSVLVALAGQGRTRGTVAINMIPLCTNQSIAAILPSPQFIPEYLYYDLAARYDELRSLSTGGTGRGALNLGQIGSLRFPLPPISEQHAIVDALADIDSHIRTLEAIVVKKGDIQRAAMHKLLTGAARLSGFATPWKRTRIGDIGVFFKGSGITRTDLDADGVPCIRYGELYTRYCGHIHTPIERVRRAVAKTALPLKPGDLLFACSGETADEIGRCSAYMATEPAYAGGDIAVLRPDGQDSCFLGYLMNHRQVAAQKARLGQGDAVVHISIRSLSGIEIELPTRLEQKAIGTVLADIDREIEAIRRRIAKVRAVRIGMMQQLLTGRVRLITATARTQTATPATLSRHSWQFNEAVVIAVLADQFGSEEFPLGRLRYTKFSYLLHRHSDGVIGGYLKKAAGPYNPRTRYGGPERIAETKGYTRKHRHGRLRGLVAGAHIEEARRYFNQWYGEKALTWLEQFRRRRNEELEVLTTVDMAAVELRDQGETVSPERVHRFLQDTPEWKQKLGRTAFTDAGIGRAIEEGSRLFPATDGGDYE